MSVTAEALAAALSRRAAPDYAGEAWAALNRVSSEFASVFSDAGFEPFDPSILQPADLLFELYGEEMWERAFVIEDDRRESWCLRLDFTVPIVSAHFRDGGHSAARYGYFGPVFRRAGDQDQLLQHVQAGVEVLGEASTVEADAEILDLSLKALRLGGATAFETVTGDLAIVFALLDSLDMAESWRRRLRRRFRRPQQFAALLAQFGGPLEAEAAERLAHLKSIGGMSTEDAAAAAARISETSLAPQIGVRSRDEILDRFLQQAADAARHPLSRDISDLIAATLALSAPLPEAPAKLRALFDGAGVGAEPQLAAALERLEARLAALSARGVDVDALRFDADFGRNLDYYDGFVFEMQHRAPDGALVKLGGGGRYDQMCRLFETEGAATGIGAALRPEAVMRISGEAPA